MYISSRSYTITKRLSLYRQHFIDRWVITHTCIKHVLSASISKSQSEIWAYDQTYMYTHSWHTLTNSATKWFKFEIQRATEEWGVTIRRSSEFHKTSMSKQRPCVTDGLTWKQDILRNLRRGDTTTKQKPLPKIAQRSGSQDLLALSAVFGLIPRNWLWVREIR